MTAVPAAAGRPGEAAAVDLDAVEKDHYAIEWHLCGTDGMPDLSQPLGSFCAACTDEEYVSAIEYGDVIDSAAAMVSWPCATVQLSTEVRRLRSEVAAARLAAGGEARTP